MENTTKTVIPSNEEPGLAILADDQASAPSNAPAVTDGQEILDSPDAILKPSDGSWIGSRVNLVLERFLRKNRKELAEFEASESFIRETRNQFAFFKKELSKWQIDLETMQKEVDSYSGCDIAQSLFNNRVSKEVSFFQLINDPLSGGSSAFLTAILLKTHGKTIMELARGEYAALERKFSEFKRERKDMLQKLGLN